MKNFGNYFKEEKWGAPLISFKERGGFFHYVWISARKERIEGEVMDLEGRIRDRFMIE